MQKTEIITVHVAVEIEYDAKYKEARERIVKEACRQWLSIAGCGPTGCYSAKTVADSGKEVAG